MIFKLLTLGVWMVFVPWGIGHFALWMSGIKERNGEAGRREGADMGYALCLGYMLMWAIFQLVAVPYVIKKGTFPRLAFVFEAISLTLAIAGALLFLLHIKGGLREGLAFRGKEILRMGKSRENQLSLSLWAVFLAGMLFQMGQAYRLAYADGDDAFYIPVSVTAALGETLYIIDPYTGGPGPFSLNLRYGLAPFPIWVAFVASRCRVNAAVAAHSLMPLVLIPLTYALYLEIGRCLCSGVGYAGEARERKGIALPLFLIFVELLQIFGNYSIYPASTFLLTRTRQGKAALGNVILPFFLLLFIKMAQEVKERGKSRWSNALWLMAAMTAGCLCSTMSGALCCVFVMLATFLIFLLYRKPSVLAQGFLGCLPGIAYALVYLKKW